VEASAPAQEEKKDLMKTKTYESMVLLDNALVREDEKKLAYPVKGRNRGTFVLCYFSLEKETMADIRRDWELNEKVLRSLILRVEEVPAKEHELAAAEDSADFVVPAPPPDDMVEEEEPVAEAAPADEIMVPDLNDIDLPSKG
jgi:ribosomal protein S6